MKIVPCPRPDPRLRRPPHGLLAWVLGASLAACLSFGGSAVARAGAPSAGAAAPPTAGWQAHTLVSAGWTFELPPVAGLGFITTSSEGRDDAQIRESCRVTIDGVERVRVDVWRAAEGLTLERWFERHLGFIVDARSTVRASVAAAASLPAIRVFQPRSCGAYPRVTTVMKAGPWALSVTVAPADDPTAMEVFKTLLATLRPLTEGGR